jgi:hypothetical protein
MRAQLAAALRTHLAKTLDGAVMGRIDLRESKELLALIERVEAAPEPEAADHLVFSRADIAEFTRGLCGECRDACMRIGVPRHLT